MSLDDSSDGRKVGYKTPPLHSRFKKGQSGNPVGKKKGLRNLATDAQEMLGSPVSLNEKGKAKRVSTQQAALLRLREKALNGDLRALEHLLRYAHLFNAGHSHDPTGGADIADEDRQILAAYQRLQLRQFGAPEQGNDAHPGGEAQADNGAAEGGADE